MNSSGRTGLFLKIFLGLAGFLLLMNILYAVRLLHKPAGSQAAQWHRIPDFLLTDQNGRDFTPSQLKGKVWVAGFVYTSCPGPCPVVTRNMAVIQKELAGSGVEFVTITVDPVRDTPAVLKEYSRKYELDENTWHLLTGSPLKVRKIIQQGFFLVVSDAAKDAPPEAGPVIHSTRLAILDRQMRIREYVEGTAADAPEKVKSAVTKYLAEQ